MATLIGDRTETIRRAKYYWHRLENGSDTPAHDQSLLMQLIREAKLQPNDLEISKAELRASKYAILFPSKDCGKIWPNMVPVRHSAADCFWISMTVLGGILAFMFAGAVRIFWGGSDEITVL